MGLRPGHCYSDIKQRPFTRVAVRVHEKNYIGTIPPIKIRQFNMGNPMQHYENIIDLIADEAVQIRDNALESLRISMNRFMIRRVGKDNYFMRIRVFPHQVLREHKQAQGASADRVSQGMSHAFGVPIGRAVRVKPGTVILSILTLPEHIGLISKTLEQRANSKLPCRVRVVVHKDVASIGTLPKKVIVEEEKVEEKKEKVAAEAEQAETAEAPAKEEGKKAEKEKEEKKEEKKQK